MKPAAFGDVLFDVVLTLHAWQGLDWFAVGVLVFLRRYKVGFPLFLSFLPFFSVSLRGYSGLWGSWC